MRSALFNDTSFFIQTLQADFLLTERNFWTPISYYSVYFLSLNIFFLTPNTFHVITFLILNSYQTRFRFPNTKCYTFSLSLPFLPPLISASPSRDPQQPWYVRYRTTQTAWTAWRTVWTWYTLVWLPRSCLLQVNTLGVTQDVGAVVREL